MQLKLDLFDFVLALLIDNSKHSKMSRAVAQMVRGIAYCAWVREFESLVKKEALGTVRQGSSTNSYGLVKLSI